MKLKTIEQRRKIDRERLKRWRKNKLAKGNKQIQLMLTPEAQVVLEDEKARSGEPYVRIINRAIIDLKESMPKVRTRKAKRVLEPKAIREMIVKMDRAGKNHSQISKQLNDEGISTLSGKGKWYPGTVRNILRMAKSRFQQSLSKRTD